MSVLDRIVDATREAVAPRPRAAPLSELEGRLHDPRDDRPFREALTRPGVSLIAEHKRRSPSAGEIRSGATVSDVVAAYERGGAVALSILTEGPHFGGSLDDLREARSASVLPILRKDFIVDAYQVYESAVPGAASRGCGGGGGGAHALRLPGAARGGGPPAALPRGGLAPALGVLGEVH